MKKYWYNLKKYSNLLMELVAKDIKLKYRRSYLGLLWTLLNPLLMMIVLTIVFSTLFQRSIPNFPVYLLTGRVLFEFFSQSTKTAMNAVVGSSSLIKKIYIPKYIFPISKVLSSFVNLSFSLGALLLVMIVTKLPFTWVQLLFPIPLVYLLVFSMGIGLALSCITVFFRDTVHLYGVIITALTYLTPLFYPAESITNEVYHLILRYNPLYYFISMFRNIIMYNSIPTLQDHLICIGFSSGAFLIGLYFFYRKQDKFILHI